MLAGLYTFIEMILAALAVIASVGVLIIVHTPQQIEPSYSLRKLSNALCRFVCMKNLYEQEDSSPSRSTGIKRIKVAPMTITGDSKEHGKSQIPNANNGEEKEEQDDDEEADYSEEYAFYALVIDRTLFWLFLFLNIILMIVLLAIYPCFSTQKSAD